MFWLRFVIGGLIIAGVPWVSSHLSNRIAGYLLVVPIMFTIGFYVQDVAHGNKATVSLIQSALWGIPPLFVFGFISIYALRHNTPIILTLAISLVGWAIALSVITMLTA